MVLRLKTWESRSPPNLERNSIRISLNDTQYNAGWSSPVARQAHNLKVVGSNPTPATNKTHHIKDFATAPFGELFAFWSRDVHTGDGQRALA